MYDVNGRSEKEFKWEAVESDLWNELVIVIVFKLRDNRMMKQLVDSIPNLQIAYAGLQVTGVIHVTNEFKEYGF